MASDDPKTETTTRKKGILIPLLIGLVLAVGAGAGGYWAVTNGPFASGASGSDSVSDDHAGTGHGDSSDDEAPVSRPDLAEVAFVPLEPVVVNLGPEGSDRHLLFSAELEVAPDDAPDVTHLAPRVMDVLNSYLRVMDMTELSDPRTLGRLRAQLLRRIQIVTGDVLVRDLLVTQFVVN